MVLSPSRLKPLGLGADMSLYYFHEWSLTRGGATCITKCWASLTQVCIRPERNWVCADSAFYDTPPLWPPTVTIVFLPPLLQKPSLNKKHRVAAYICTPLMPGQSLLARWLNSTQNRTWRQNMCRQGDGQECGLREMWQLAFVNSKVESDSTRYTGY